tara:strand:- start:393 stop:1019 length:627 start_codon:yes stop_codon:yes gene_type:complete
MPDYNLTTSQNAGSMTLQELLPGVDMDQYDWDSFEDVIPEFSTALLDITKQQGRQDISNTMSGSQESFMNTPSSSTIAGAGGFGGAGGGGRGLIGYGQAQEGMFSDVFGAMQGAEKANITQMESLKDEAFSFFSNIQGDLKQADSSDEEGGEDGNRDSGGMGNYGPTGSPTYIGNFSGEEALGANGQTYIWNSTLSIWEITSGSQTKF